MHSVLLYAPLFEYFDQDFLGEVSEACQNEFTKGVCPPILALWYLLDSEIFERLYEPLDNLYVFFHSLMSCFKFSSDLVGCHP